MQIVRKNGIPKYNLLKDALVNEVKGGNYKAGDKFYTEKELMQKYCLSYATVTHALRKMVAEGYFLRKKSLGTFITEKALKEVSFEKRIMMDPLYINDISHLCSRTQTPLSWHPFDQLQKGIINTYNGPIKIVPLDEILNRKNINTIIINPEDMREAQATQSKPIIINLRHDVFLDYNSVTRDILMSMHRLMTYLIRELGHETIGFIGGNTIRYHSSLFAGYEIGLRTFFLPFKEEYVVRGLPGTVEDGYNAMKTLLSRPVPPTAVVADTDIKAIGAVRAARDAGLNVPGDISVAGFGCNPETETIEPLLTTVRIPFYEMGEKAVELLQERIRTGNDVKTAVLNGTLIIKDSCAKVSKSH